MILGIGSDLCNIDRIARVLDRHGDRFRKRVFTDIELALATRRSLAASVLDEGTEIYPANALPELLPRADALIICLPHTPLTDGLLGVA